MPTSAAANPGNKENANRSSSGGGGTGGGMPHSNVGGAVGKTSVAQARDASTAMHAAVDKQPDTQREALRTGVAIAGTILGALVGFPGGGLISKAIPEKRTVGDRLTSAAQDVMGGGFGGPGRAGPHGGGTGGMGAGVNPMAQRLAQMAQATGGGGQQQATPAPAPAPSPGATPMLSPGAVPAATNPYTYGETGPEKVFFPQSSQILTDLAQRIQKLTAKDLTGVDKIDPLTGLPMKPKPAKPAAMRPAISTLADVLT